MQLARATVPPRRRKNRTRQSQITARTTFPLDRRLEKHSSQRRNSASSAGFKVEISLRGSPVARAKRISNRPTELSGAQLLKYTSRRLLSTGPSAGGYCPGKLAYFVLARLSFAPRANKASAHALTLGDEFARVKRAYQCGEAAGDLAGGPRHRRAHGSIAPPRRGVGERPRGTVNEPGSEVAARLGGFSCAAREPSGGGACCR